MILIQIFTTYTCRESWVRYKIVRIEGGTRICWVVCYRVVGNGTTAWRCGWEMYPRVHLFGASLPRFLNIILR
jgi:hypothetical protein